MFYKNKKEISAQVEHIMMELHNLSEEINGRVKPATVYPVRLAFDKLKVCMIRLKDEITEEEANKNV